jgi:acetoin utilization deacetylase AcuC-like enzyme
MFLMETLYLTHPDCRLHEMGPGHPECPDRLDAIADQLLASGLAPLLEMREAPSATLAQIETVHDAAYVADLFERAPTEGYVSLDPDTSMNAYTLSAAMRGAGAGIAAVDAVMRGETQTAFCAVRPPGHHALRDRAMGFCFFNNIVIAARHALDTHALSRIAVIDFDVHHGNGTESLLAGDDRALMCSFYQDPLFPNRGTAPGADNMVNIPVAPYSGGDVVRALVREHWMPRLTAHRPELILISAGFDAHREDDMAQMSLVEADYAWITEQIVQVADEHAGGRIVSCLEGGYNLSALGRSVVAHIRALSKL